LSFTTSVYPNTIHHQTPQLYTKAPQDAILDYGTRPCKQLRGILERRGIDRRKLGLKAQLVATAEASDVRKRKNDEEMEQELTKKTQA
jgi:hypothetical protein